MNIIDAARAMREGKSVRRPQWFPWEAYSKNDFDNNNADTFLGLDDLLADDWEIDGGEG